MHAIRAQRGSKKALWKKATTASLAVARFKKGIKHRGYSKILTPPKSRTHDRLRVIEDTVESVKSDVVQLKREMSDLTKEMRGMVKHIRELCTRLEAI